MTDAFADVTLIRQGVELLDWTPFGIPVKVMLDLTLLALFAWGIAFRGFKVARWTGRFVWGRSAPKGNDPAQDKNVVTDPTDYFSDAAKVVVDTLCYDECTYDPKTHRLHGPGLLVEFESEAQYADIKKILGSPSLVNCATGAGVATGVDLKELISEDELKHIDNAARTVRKGRITFDKIVANQAAAREMMKSAHQTRLRAYPRPDTDDYDLPAGYRDENPTPMPAANIHPSLATPKAQRWLSQKELRGGLNTNPPKKGA